MNLYTVLSHLHSVNRWFVLIFLLLAIIFSIVGVLNKNSGEGNQSDYLPKWAKPAFIFTHVQLLLGLLLYVLGLMNKVGGSPHVIMKKEAWDTNVISKFYSVTHFSIMLPAIVLITVGYIVAKKSKTASRSSLIILVSYLLGLALILWGIPWPGQGLSGDWY